MPARRSRDLSFHRLARAVKCRIQCHMIPHAPAQHPLQAPDQCGALNTAGVASAGRARTAHEVAAGEHKGEHDDAGDGLRGLGHPDARANQQPQALCDLFQEPHTFQHPAFPMHIQCTGSGAAHMGCRYAQYLCDTEHTTIACEDVLLHCNDQWQFFAP